MPVIELRARHPRAPCRFPSGHGCDCRPQQQDCAHRRGRVCILQSSATRLRGVDSAARRTRCAQERVLQGWCERVPGNCVTAQLHSAQAPSSCYLLCPWSSKACLWSVLLSARSAGRRTPIRARLFWLPSRWARQKLLGASAASGSPFSSTVWLAFVACWTANRSLVDRSQAAKGAAAPLALYCCVALAQPFAWLCAHLFVYVCVGVLVRM